jgi:lipid-A-disaccharide synthase
MKIFFIVGEKSADQHSSDLISYIKKMDPDWQLIGWGGDAMAAAGMHLLKHHKELSFMGFVEVLKNLFKIRDFLNEAKTQIVDFKPDILFLVDYSGFNLRLAKWAYSQGIRVDYYIAPKTWAWNSSRNKKLKTYIQNLYLIFPFEEAYFTKKGLKNVFYVGNPTAYQISKFLENNGPQEKVKSIALLPGSRKQEIEKMLGLMAEIQKFYPEYAFKVAAVNDFPETFYKDISQELELHFQQTYSIVNEAEVAIVSSGTATLETALIGTPQVVVYKTNPLTYYIAKSFIKLKFISLVNILQSKAIVPELIQDQYKLSRLKKELDALLFDNKHRNKQLIEIKELKDRMGSNNPAERIYKLLKKE